MPDLTVRSVIRAFSAVTVMLIAITSGTGCRSLMIDPLPDRMSPPDQFSATGAAALPAEWWTIFGDEQLNTLIEQALAGNFSIRAAWDRLDQAEALAAKQGAALRPSLTGSGDLTHRESTGTTQPDGAELGLALAASYELDLWGRVRTTRDAARKDAHARHQDLRAAAVTLSAEIASAWFQLIEAQGQLRLTGEQLKANEDQLEVIESRFRGSRASATDVLQQRQLVQSTKGERIRLQSKIDVIENKLAVLSGRLPGADLPTPKSALPAVPPFPQTGLPAEWIRERPDLCAAELRIQAADKRLSAAIADRFPKITLSARGSTSAASTGELFESWIATLAAGLSAPILDGGARRAEVRRTRAVTAEALNTYSQAVLSAVREVEDALTQEKQQHGYVASLEQELALSADASDQIRGNYILTGADFTRYLGSLVSHQRLQRTLLESRRLELEYRISLCRSIGGGWSLVRPPSRDE